VSLSVDQCPILVSIFAWLKIDLIAASFYCNHFVFAPKVPAQNLSLFLQFSSCVLIHHEQLTQLAQHLTISTAYAVSIVMSQRNKQAPTTWAALERGRASSFGSLESITEDEQQRQEGPAQTQSLASRVPQSHRQDQDEHGLRKRRSSIAMRLNSIRQVGGVNSIDNFVHSFQRAAAFHEITPVRRASVSLSVAEDDEEVGQREGHPRRPQLKSMLTAQMEGAEPQSQSTPEPVRSSADENTVQTQPSETTTLLPATSNQPAFSIRSRLGSEAPLGVSYGSISSRISQSARRRASILIQQQVEASQRAKDLPDEDKDVLTERPVEVETRPDGEIVERTVGESTVPMTIFNSTNVLIGVGILALPLAVRYSGWVIGLVMLTGVAIVTEYTAKLLARCLDTNTASSTYGDVAFLAMGTWGRSLVEIIFLLELTAANVALIILFGDSMNSLIPSVSVLTWKAILALGLLPLNFVPFKYLSVTSILGICCVVGIILLVFTDGLIKPHAPGSLREISQTYAFPRNLRTIPLGVGLFLAPWGGHSVFPAIYKDMRHPQKYPRAVRVTYISVYGLNITMIVIGYLMFGELVLDEVTANILGSKSYPRAISIIMLVLIGIIPITKIPLSNRPMMDTINKKFMIDLRQMDAKARAWSQKSLSHRLSRGSIAVFINIFELGVAIGLPDFDSIMALMGSAFCFSICILLPCAFYLKIFHGSDSIKLSEKIVCWILIIVSLILGTAGTVSACLPKEKLGLGSL